MLRYFFAFVLVMLALPAAAQTFDLDLDTMPGHFSEWSMKELQPSGEISAKATVADLRADPRWSASLQVMLRGNNEYKDYAALVVAFEPQTQSARPALKVVVNGATVSESVIATEVQKEKPVDIVVKWRADRTLEASVGGIAAKPVKLPFAPVSLHLLNSTSEVKFLDVRLKFGK